MLATFWDRMDTQVKMLPPIFWSYLRILSLFYTYFTSDLCFFLVMELVACRLLHMSLNAFAPRHRLSALAEVSNEANDRHKPYTACEQHVHL